MGKPAMPFVAVAVMAIVVAGCSGSSKKSSSTSTGGTSSTAASSGSSSSSGGTGAKGAGVALRKVSFGTVLVGANNHTVYLFEKDKGTKSMCTGACTGEWSPLTTSGQPSAGSGLTASLVGTSKRSDGMTQVTYGGHPLYYYADDKRPGQTEGEGKKEFGAEWYAVGATGKKVEKAGS
jgi:predicted lipoprotein with Yx(FWY)xxD motif